MIWVLILTGFYASNKETYDIEDSWSKIEKSFISLDKNGLVQNTSVNNAESVKNKFTEIIEEYKIEKVEKVEQAIIIARSYAVLEQNNNKDSKYAIVRVYFKFTDTTSSQKEKFLYFYFYRAKSSKIFSEWSLFNIETEDSVTIK